MKLRSTSLIAVAALAASALATALPSTSAGAAPAASAPATSAAASAADPLGAAAVDKARAHLRAKAADFGLSAGDVDGLEVASVVTSKHNGLTNVWFQQRYKSIPIHNAMLNVSVRADGSVFKVASSAVKGADALVSASSPTISDVAAAQAAAAALGLRTTGSFETGAQASGLTRARTLGAAGISHDPIPVQLAYQLDSKGKLALTWQLVINQLDGQHWWSIRMDAGSGAEVDRSDWVSEDSHNVFAFPTEAPSFGARSVVTNPATSASPFGWNDTNGAAGAESTRTVGNNVSAYTDTNDDDAPDAGSSPDGGAGLAFNFPLNLANAPSTYRPAAVSNLYYANNRIHDVMYRFGFDEGSANFQVNNYGNGGAAGDSVNAEAQDGGGTNNANFATPPDGQKPRMQMYVWSGSPQIDGDLDNGIIVHEYGHGISNRLTGGGTNVDCLENDEQGGEGWSDYFALVMTQDSATEQAAGRGIGTYALDEPVTGPGIRTQKYSTNLAINNHTYDDIKSLAVPHGVGEVWATMLWDLNWAMVDEYGYSANLVTGNGGNVKALQLVIDGLKLNPCSPGFVDARDAILEADEANNAGANQCLIWSVFARRGLGASADQGSSDSADDGTEAFDLPVSCLGIELTATAAPDPIPAGSQVTYTLKAHNVTTGTLNGVVLTSTLGSTTTYVAGSATCGGTFDNATKTITFTLNNIAADATRTCKLRATAQASPVSQVKFEDDFEPNLSNWQVSHTAGTTDWVLSTAQAHSPTHSAFADDPGALSDKFLRSASPVAVATGDTLQFWHNYAMESGFDGGVVEVSTNGGTTWADVGAAAFTENGYDAVISSNFSSPIAGRQAFTGSSPWARSTVNLNAFAGQNILVRFRAASDVSVAATGWYVDDVTIGRVVLATNHLEVDVPGIGSQEQDLATKIVGASVAVPPAPSVTGSTAVGGGVRVAFAPNGNGGSPITGYTANCTSTNGGATKTKTGTVSPITVTGLTVGKSYHCRVRATNAVGAGPYSAFGATVPVVATAPLAPAVTATTSIAAGLRVAFASGGDGGSAITGWTAQCVSTNAGVTKTAGGAASPLTVTGLTSGKSYHCRVRGTNAVGVGAFSPFGATLVWP